MKYLLGIIFFVLSIALFPQPIHAADLSTAMLRLNKLTANTAVSGLACATPASTATEARLQIIFPSDFSISNSGWSVNTSNIPSGSTAWPGISYNSASSTTVTFNSSDLTAGTRYCFNFTASGSTTGTTGQKTTTIRTLTSGNSPIDTKEIGLTIRTSDTVTVNAEVAASASDFTSTLAKISPSTNIFPPNQTIAYSLEYESLLPYTTTVEVVASWTQGTIAGSGTPSLDIADYVLGSASTGYGGATPVVDTINRTITWTVPSMPGNTPSTVTFELETTEAYTGSEAVNFTVNGVLEGPGTQSTTSNITSQYQYDGSSTPTPTNIPGSTSTPAPGRSPTLTPTPGSTSPLYQSIDITRLTANSATIEVFLSQLSQSTISYGASVSKLNQSIKSAVNSTSHTFILSELISDTTYYFRVVSGSSTSDLFTFTTAVTSDAPSVELSSLVIESNNVLLIDPLTAEEKNRTAVVPSSSNFQIKFKVNKKYEVKRVQTFIQAKNVLGINTFAQTAQAAGFNTNMTPVGNNEYSGRLFASSTPGIYQLFAKIYDTNGNIIEEKILDIKISDRMKVLNPSGQPIEGAELLLYYLDPVEKRYLIVSSQAISIQNPSFSNYEGYFNITLPQGSYKARITAIGYAEKEVNFTLGVKTGQDYPSVTLTPTPFTFLSFFQYYLYTFTDFASAFILTVIPLSRSYRFVDLTAFFICTSFILLTFVSFIFRTKFHLGTIHHFVLMNLPFIKNRIKSPLQVKILHAETKNSLSDVMVYIENDKKQIILSSKSQKNGTVYLMLPPNTALITFVKQGYEPVSLSFLDAIETKTIELKTQEDSMGNITSKVSAIFRSFFALLFEVCLMLSFLLELFFFFTWSPFKILPFFILSILNLWIWITIKRSTHQFI